MSWRGSDQQFPPPLPPRPPRPPQNRPTLPSPRSIPPPLPPRAASYPPPLPPRPTVVPPESPPPPYSVLPASPRSPRSPHHGQRSATSPLSPAAPASPQYRRSATSPLIPQPVVRLAPLGSHPTNFSQAEIPRSPTEYGIIDDLSEEPPELPPRPVVRPAASLDAPREEASHVASRNLGASPRSVEADEAPRLPSRPKAGSLLEADLRLRLGNARNNLSEAVNALSASLASRQTPQTLPKNPQRATAEGSERKIEPAAPRPDSKAEPEAAYTNLCSLCLKLRPPHYNEKGHRSTQHTCVWRHHASFAELIASANAGCPLCDLFKPFVENVAQRRKKRLDEWNKTHQSEGKEEKGGDLSPSESQSRHSESSSSIGAIQRPSSPSYCSTRPQTGSLEDPFESDYGRDTPGGSRIYSNTPSAHLEIEGNEAYYYTDEVREKFYGEQGDSRYYIITKEKEGDDEFESKIEEEIRKASDIIDLEDKEEKEYWQRWTAPGPKPWENRQTVTNPPSSPPSPPPVYESPSAAENPILQWLFHSKNTATGPEQLWVTSFFHEEYGLPNSRQNKLSPALRLFAGSVSLDATEGTFCCDGISVPNVHVLAQTFPGLWKWKHDDLRIVRRKPLRAKEPFFEFFQQRGSNPQSLYPIPARNVLPDPKSPSSFAVAKTWLEACATTHPQCNAESEKLFPKRLLCVGTREEPYLKLIHGNRLAPSDEYIALSHCWGKDANAITKFEGRREAQWVNVMDEGLLTRNFQDAIAIARGMGIKYLWIDALCIKQDDKNDWAEEASKMGLYYRHAILVVSALSSPETSHGILCERASDADAVATPHVGRSIAIRPLLPDATFVMDLESFSELRKQPPSLPLKARAWTLQERLFARRLLHYTAEQMIWQCKTCLFGEDGQFADADPAKPTVQGDNNDLMMLKSLKPSKLNPRGLPTVAKTGWFELLKYYTGRRMTFPSDLLPGISSLAREINAATRCTYRAGIWWGSRRTRLASLLWEPRDRYERDGPSARREHLLPGEIALRPAYFAGSADVPSWSWASFTGRLAGPSETSIDNASTAIESPGVDAEFGRPVVRPLSEADEFGAVQPGGYIPTEGFLFPYVGEDTYKKELLPTAGVFNWGSREQRFANFDVPSVWETPFEGEDLDSDPDEPVDLQEEKRRKRSLRDANKGREYADKDLFVLYVSSFNEFADDNKTKKWEWQIFFLLQRSCEEVETLDWEGWNVVKTKRDVYKRVGIASTPEGTRLKIGSEGWERKKFRFY